MRWYAIRVGRRCNTVVDNWGECSDLVTGHPGAIYKSFPAHERSQAAGFAASAKADKKKYDSDKRDRAWAKKHPCIMRGNVNGKNRCIMRQGPTATGVNYIPSDDDSIPWGD